MAALGTSEKGARNALPQLRALGLVETDGSPTDLALDLRDDDHYGAACERILGTVYPDALRNAYDDPDGESSRVASWFMRNARTGQATANMQAKLYLTLLKGELPSGDEKPRTARKRAAKRSVAGSPGTRVPETPTAATPEPVAASTIGSAPQLNHPPMKSGSAASLGPTLHIDLQIHVSADASDSQIDAVFRSMAKHLYGRE